jgi:AhpD family alkylhydroperoxidase
MQRFNYTENFQEAFNKFYEVESLIKKTSIDKKLCHLVKLRASQINGCAFCIDMHSKEAKIDGERELRLYHISAWEESPLFSPAEKAALLWTEAVTKLNNNEKTDIAYGKLREFYSEKEITELTVIIGMINLWNRFAIPFHSVPGSMDKMMGLDKAGL